MEQKVKIGTRGSELALWQAQYVQKCLSDHGIASELVIIETKGDRILNKTISKIGSKGVFTEELEDSLRSGEIDLAVHSAKDIQSVLPDDLDLIAFAEREKVNDVVISFNKDFRLDSSQKWLVGTSSTRRVATLKKYFPNVRTTSIRGNLRTRMRKLEEGECDALLLAYAGVKRMGFEKYIVEELPVDTFTPAAGQGAVAIEALKNISKKKKNAIRKAVNHEETECCILAERSFLKRLEGGCSIPVFALAELHGQLLEMEAGIISTNGKQVVREKYSAPSSEAELLGLRIAESVLANGGEPILNKIKAKAK